MTTIDIIKNAIINRKHLTFDYHNHHRIVEPHHYGTLNGTKKLQAYQVAGGTNSGGIPDWRNFTIAEIENIKEENVLFTPQPSHHAAGSHYTSIDFSV